MKKRILLLTFTLNSIISFGQLSEWLVNVDNSEYFLDIAADSNNGIYSVGSIFDTLKIKGIPYVSPNNINTGYRAFLLKTDSLGNLLWCKAMSEDPGNNNTKPKARHVHVDANEDVIISVFFNDSLKVENDTVLYASIPASGILVQSQGLLKYDKNGNFLWARVIPKRFYDIYANTTLNTTLGRSKISSDANGNLYFDPYGDYASPPSEKYKLYKYSSQGTLLDSIKQTGFSDFTLDPTNNLFVGWAESDTFLVKYNSSGNISNVIYATQGNPTISRLESDDSGNIFVYGYSNNNKITIANTTLQSNSNYIGLTYLAKLNSSGQVVWIKEIGCTVSEAQGDLKVIDDDIIVSGVFFTQICYDNFSFADVSQMHKSFIMKISTNGNFSWFKYLKRSLTSYFIYSKLTLGPKGNIYASLTTQYKWYTDSVIVDHLTEGGYGYGMLYKIKDGTNLISGFVYVDSNSNNLPNYGDRFIENKVIDLNSQYKLLTDNNGYYYAYVPQGNYSISIPNPLLHHTLSPSLHNASFSSPYQSDTSNHFKFAPIPGITDVRLNMTTQRNRASLRLNRTVVSLNYKNIGTSIVNDTIFLQFDSSLISFDSSNHTPIGIPDSICKFKVLNFKPYEKREIKLYFRINKAQMGDTLPYYTKIGPIALDSIPSDNYDSAYQVVVASFDPNDKQVQPEGRVLPEYVSNQNYFVYTIRFQNTGNDTAIYVRIRDTLSSKLNVSTFEFLNSSHNVDVRLSDNHILDFIFDPISLPDSNVNQAESHGYVKFRIKADQTLGDGDFFENTAYIYFDNNEPVVTNTTHTEISDWAGFENHDKEEKGIHIYPNPAKSEFSILLKNPSKSAVNIEIIDITGRIVFSKRNMKMNSDVITLSSLNLTKGIYVVKVVQDVQFYNSKIVIE